MGVVVEGSGKRRERGGKLWEVYPRSAAAETAFLAWKGHWRGELVSTDERHLEHRGIAPLEAFLHHLWRP